jgi:hypothetical protein
MKLRIVVSLLALATVFGVSASAQELPKIDVSASYSFFRAIPSSPILREYNLNGGSASAAYNVKDWLSGVFDFGGYTVGTANGASINNHLLTYMAGPRFTYRHRRLSPFGQVLVGAATAGSGVFATSNSHTGLATAFGVGVDWNVRDRFSIRPVQVDYLLTHLPEVGNSNTLTQNNVRYSAGIVFHFK